MNQIGFHFVDNQFSDAQVSKHFGLLTDCKPACITILGASQYEQALAFAKRAKQAFPAMRVIFRHYIDGGDDGMHTRITAREWWERIGKLYTGTGLTILSDNESMRDDLTPYAAWQSEVMELAGAAGVGIAYGRFSTHNPPTSKIQHLDKMLISAFKFGKLHTFSPNVYWSADNIDGLKYPYYVIDYAAKLGLALDTTIGEFALLRDVRDAWHGWRSCNVSGERFALDAISKAKAHLPDIPVCLYSVGQWPINADTFSLDDAVISTIKANLTPLKEQPMTPTTNASGQYDLTAFLRGNGEAYVVKNNWASDEVMWTEADGANRWRLRKNGHSEEFGLTASHIVRGIDDSPGDGEAYILSNVDGSQGSPWSPRWMRPGESFKRTAVVTFYKIASGQQVRQYTHVTWLKFVKYHVSWVSPYGLVVPAVAEFEAYSDNGGVQGAAFERYWYAEGLGLVGWRGGANLSMSSGIASRPGNLPKVARIPINWYGGLQMAADIIIEATDSRWRKAKVKTAGSGKVNLRRQPNTSAEIVGSLLPDTVYTGRAIEAAFTGSDGKKWYAVDLLVSGVQLTAWAREDVVTVDWITIPTITPMERAEALAIVGDLKTSMQDTFARLTAFEDKLNESTEPTDNSI